jgi:hypothetical protein
MLESKRAQEALERVYKKVREIKTELVGMLLVKSDILDIIKEEYEKEGGDKKDLEKL